MIEIEDLIRLYETSLTKGEVLMCKERTLNEIITPADDELYTDIFMVRYRDNLYKKLESKRND